MKSPKDWPDPPDWPDRPDRRVPQHSMPNKVGELLIVLLLFIAIATFVGILTI